MRVILELSKKTRMNICCKIKNHFIIKFLASNTKKLCIKALKDTKLKQFVFRLL